MAATDPQGDIAGPAPSELDRRLDSLTEELRQLRELIKRTYEDTQTRAVQLLAARRDAAYAAAYEENPLISVRVGTYAGGEMLFARALASVRAQSYGNWEAIVVCDGREEDVAAGIDALGDPRVRCLQRPRNGPYPEDRRARWQVAGAHPFNEGFAAARGAWIAPIDQDDEWEPDHLEVLLGAARRSRAELVYGVGRVRVGEDGDTYFGRWPPELGDFGFQTALYHAGLTAFLYDANAHLLDEPADWNLARRMLEAGVRFEFLERIVTTYFVESDAGGIEWWRARLRERGSFAGAGAS